LRRREDFAAVAEYVAFGAAAAAVLGGAGVHWYLWKRYHYICAKCLRAFKPKSFWRSLRAVNNGAYRKFKCPHCGQTDYMKAEKDGSRT
jgi:DNA-directed RNA polymerase subunit RPC12/RpoP